MPDSIEALFRRVRSGDQDAFASWYRLTAVPVRRSLRGFARAVDVEAVFQEAMLRMWTLAPALDLEGANASLRYALVLARRIALQEARRFGRATPVEIETLETLPEGSVAPDPPPDEMLRRAVADCLDRLPRKAGEALRARIGGEGTKPDRDLARALGMRLNTFLQNVVRARRFMRKCLEGRGIRLQEIAS